MTIGYLSLPAIASQDAGLVFESVIEADPDAVEGKTPQQIVDMHRDGVLEGEVSASDFALALRHTQPSVTTEETAAYVAWNREHGSMPNGEVSGPNLATPERSTPARPTPDAKRVPRSAPLTLDDEEEAEAGEVIEDVC